MSRIKELLTDTPDVIHNQLLFDNYHQEATHRLINKVRETERLFNQSFQLIDNLREAEWNKRLG